VSDISIPVLRCNEPNKKSNYPSISIDIQTIRQQISDVLRQKLLRRLPLPPYHIDPILRQFDQGFAEPNE